MAASPAPSSLCARQTMRANRRTDTAPELALRSELHRLGLRFRKDLRLKLGGASVRPDIVFTRAKVAVFVDGCFWHSCPEHGQMPKANRNYWESKLDRNVERDRSNDAALIEAGWMVLRFFEHVPAGEAAAVVRDAVSSKASEISIPGDGRRRDRGPASPFSC
jgi:DNA mismatch endonuclease (patch repair protein)